MKVRKSADAIRTFAYTLAQLGLEKDASSILDVVLVLDEFGKTEMATFLRKGRAALETQTIDTAKPRASDAAKSIAVLSGLIAELSPRGPSNDLKLLAQLLARDSANLSATLDALRAAMTDRFDVEQMATKLRDAVGTERFDSLYAKIKAPAVKLDDLKRLAVLIYGAADPVKNKTAALKQIRGPHDARMSARLGIEASGGRSAA